MTTPSLVPNTSRTGVVKGKGSPIADDKPAMVSTGESILNAGATKALNSMLKKTGMTIDQFNAKHAPKGAETKVVDGVLHAAFGDLVGKEKELLSAKAPPVTPPTVTPKPTLSERLVASKAAKVEALPNIGGVKPITPSLTNPIPRAIKSIPVGGIAKGVGSALAVIPEAINTVNDVTGDNLTAHQKAWRVTEGATRTGLALAGGEAGALAGAPLAPFTLGASIPIGAAIGGGLGYFAPDMLNSAVKSMGGNGYTLPSDIAKQNRDANQIQASSAPTTTTSPATPEVTAGAKVTAVNPQSQTVPTSDQIKADDARAKAPMQSEAEKQQMALEAAKKPISDIATVIPVTAGSMATRDTAGNVVRHDIDGKVVYTDSTAVPYFRSPHNGKTTPSLVGQLRQQPEVVQPLTSVGGQAVNNLGVPTGQQSTTTATPTVYHPRDNGMVGLPRDQTTALAHGSTPQERFAIQQRELAQPVAAAPIDQRQALINNLLRQSQVHDGTFGGASRRKEAAAQAASLMGISQDDRKLNQADSAFADKKQRDLVGDTQTAQAAIAASAKDQRDYLLRAREQTSKEDGGVTYTVGDDGVSKANYTGKLAVKKEAINSAMQNHEANPIYLELLNHHTASGKDKNMAAAQAKQDLEEIYTNKLSQGNK